MRSASSRSSTSIRTEDDLYGWNPSWKEWAGRSSGSEKFCFGDITRHYVRRLLGRDVPSGRYSRSLRSSLRISGASSSPGSYVEGRGSQRQSLLEEEAQPLATHAAPLAAAGPLDPRLGNGTIVDGRWSGATLVPGAGDDPARGGGGRGREADGARDSWSSDRTIFTQVDSFGTIVPPRLSGELSEVEAAAKAAVAEAAAEEAAPAAAEEEEVPCTACFDSMGLDIVLEGTNRTVALRRKGSVLHGVAALGAAPSAPSASSSASPRPSLISDNFRYSFEFEVLEVRRGSVRTMSVGVVWGLPGRSLESSLALSTVETADHLARALVVGGELPRWFFDRREVAKVEGWRPIRDLQEGSRIQVVLEAAGEALRLAVLQDGSLRTERQVLRTRSSQPWAYASLPRGVVDVCGTVRRVRLLGQEWSPGEGTQD